MHVIARGGLEIRGVDIARRLHCGIFLLDFKTVPTVWNFSIGF
jgi:hypothetical protein